MNTFIMLLFLLITSLYFSMLIFNMGFIAQSVNLLVLERQRFFAVNTCLEYAKAYYKKNKDKINLPIIIRVDLSEIIKDLSNEIKIQENFNSRIEISATASMANKFVGQKKYIINKSQN